MATYVLVGGAWLGGWAWREVAGGLRARRHTVYPATLTGLGERVHLATPDVDLDTHITDVTNLMEYEDLNDVILVGHSYSGIVVEGAADRAANRVRVGVFVDTAPMGDGVAHLDFYPPPQRDLIRSVVESEGDGWRLPFPGLEQLAQQATVGSRRSRSVTPLPPTTPACSLRTPVPAGSSTRSTPATGRCCPRPGSWRRCSTVTARRPVTGSAAGGEGES